MEVADAHRVVVAQRPDADLGRGPRPDPGHGGQPRVGLGERQVDDRLEPGRPGGDPPDEVGPALLDAERVVGVVGERGEGGRRRTEPEPPFGRARAPPRRGRGSRPSHARRASWPVTFCSRMAGTSDSRTAPVRGIRTPGARRASSRDERVAGRDRPPASTVERRAWPGTSVERPFGARAPGLDAQLVADVDERDRGRPVARPRRPPGASAWRGGSSGRPVRATAARACGGGRADRRPGRCERASARMLPRFGFGHEPRRNHAEPPIRGTVPADVRRLKVVASVALIAILATVAVPGPVGSWVPSPAATVDPDLFRRVEVAALARGTPMTIQPQDPGARSAGTLDQGSTLIEPDLRTEPLPAPVRPAQPAARGRVASARTPGITTATSRGTARTSTATGPRAARR